MGEKQGRMFGSFRVWLVVKCRKVKEVDYEIFNKTPNYD